QGAETDEHIENATVLFVDIPSYAGVAERLDAQELAELVKRFYGNANDTVHLFGAHHMRFVGEALLAVFAQEGDSRTVNHGLRAARAALGLVDSARGIQEYLKLRYATRQLPSFAVNVALHTGPVTMALLRDPLHGSATQVLPVGDTVSAAMLLQKQGRTMGWPIAASVATLRMVTGAVTTGGRALLDLPGRSAPIDAVELVGLVS
ncbi:MAG TPA: adenylate/guanylate cyclase domain-containing protein, partial [Ramlibacter sp.]|nr:adenylate/guanylate cyclase domain-containing protein [Ramlibacter sp.]